ncbi:MAG: NAD(P)-dependent oxidoreductase [Elusimicrobia bacterium]|nr:NAD(P)-dependent oxidoreductase [Candidatus Obscuribacterium magneticum]
MHILVTGGKGFIGTNLTAELRTRGHEVATLDIVHGEEPSHVRADVRSYGQLLRFFERQRFDYVYHLAAEYGRWNGEDHYENLWETNVIGTKNMLRLQERFKFRQIFFSSCEVYGDYDGVMSEDVMDRVEIKQMNDYAISKWAGEMQVLNSAAMFGTQTVRVRPLNCYGPHEYYSPYRGVIPIFVYCAMKDQPYTVYEGHKRIFDYVEDTCFTLANILDNFKPGEVYNLGSREDWEVDIRQLSELVLNILGKSGQNVVYKKGEPFTTRIKKVDFSKIRRDFKHDPKVDLEAGLRRYIAWMRKVYAEG